VPIETAQRKSQGRSVISILALAFLFIPLTVFAQNWQRGDRADIQVINDWENTVRVTLWNERGGQMTRRTWTIPPGQTALLAREDGRSLRVGRNDKINVGNDWGQVDIGAVGQQQGRIWYVRVRDVWRATHQGGGRQGQPVLPPDPPAIPFPPFQR
jgi:hypothetical protein